MRILVVDDNADTAKTLATLLRLHGYEADAALNGPQALKKVEDWPPDIVLLDLGLPRMDGYEVAKQLRQKITMRPLRLAAVTGYGQESDRLRSIQEGFHHHFVKPIDVLDLKQWLDSVAGS
jgi:CheY-like chemotaxis protein